MKAKWILVAVISLALIGVCVAIALVGLFAVQFMPIRSSGIIIDQPSIRPSQLVSVVASEENSFAVKENPQLKVDISVGTITVTGGPGSTIEVSAEKTAWGSTPESAQARLEALTLEMAWDGNQVTIREAIPRSPAQIPGENRAPSIDLTIRVPRNTTVDLRTGSGDITLSETRGKAVLQADFGLVQASDLQAGLVARTNSGDISVHGVQPYRPGEGGVDLTTTFGNITLENASGPSIHTQTKSGWIHMQGVHSDDDVSAKAEFGEINLSQVRALQYSVDSRSGQVILDGVAGKLDVRAGFGDIQILNAGKSDLRLINQSGQIRFQGSLGAGPHTLISDFGSIYLTLPPDSAFAYDLQTQFGRVQSAFGEPAGGATDPQHWSGAVGAGGPALSATTRSGDVVIEQGR